MGKDNMSDTIKLLAELESSAKKEARTVKDLAQLDKIRLKYLGQKSKLTQILKRISKFNIEERKKVGKKSNLCKISIEEMIQAQKRSIEAETLKDAEKNEHIDITLPGKKCYKGVIHPLTQMQNLAEDIFETTT